MVSVHTAEPPACGLKCSFPGSTFSNSNSGFAVRPGGTWLRKSQVFVTQVVGLIRLKVLGREVHCNLLSLCVLTMLFLLGSHASGSQLCARHASRICTYCSGQTWTVAPKGPL